MIAILIMSVLLVVVLALQIAMLQATSRLMGSERCSWRRATLVIVACQLAAIGCLVAQGFDWFEKFPPPSGLILALWFAAAPVLIIYFAYRPTKKQWLGFVAWFGATLAVGLAVAFSCKILLVEAFVIPTNAMAPTIRGHRIEGACPNCGGLLIAGIPQNAIEARFLQGTCLSCQKQFANHEFAGAQWTGDRIVVEKLRSPARWDLVVFQYPANPKETYIKRLVGLPGEEIMIQDDGFAYANGVKLEPPSDVAQLRYSARPESGGYDHEPLWCDSRRPMKLGVDEYLMLGDNTHWSLDGRYFGPVKRSAIIGVATWLYWPLERWKIFK